MEEKWWLSYWWTSKGHYSLRWTTTLDNEIQSNGGSISLNSSLNKEVKCIHYQKLDCVYRLTKTLIAVEPAFSPRETCEGDQIKSNESWPSAFTYWLSETNITEDNIHVVFILCLLQ